MSIPMICSAALRASSGVAASLMPPALPRPPSGTWALTAAGPSSAQAAAASSGVCATLPAGIAIPSVDSTSFAWYSRSFKSRLSVLAQRKAPVVALHPVPFRVLERHLTQQLETELPADTVRGAVVDVWKRVDGAASLRRSSNLDRLRHRRGCEPASLELGHHSPSHPVDQSAVPFAIPEVHPPDDNAFGLEDRLEDVGRMGVVGVGKDAGLGSCHIFWWRISSCSAVSGPPRWSVIS